MKGFSDKQILREAEEIQRKARALGWSDEKTQEMVINSIKSKILANMTGFGLDSGKEDKK